ncbi:hypothetical protein IMSHALPRED_006086 [Imshaugia aleurites]|uniref:Uncharacterized protein n=1 Tax=Imshaugia aleurites TaxID=172621 RepID=A0A8H3FGC9_9LECA|nr:hypothetical protein IMSHALPRED_006086 [Imshaugia aleurites]
MDPITGEALKAVTGAADSLKSGGQAVASGALGKGTQSKAEGTEEEVKEGEVGGGVEDVEKSAMNSAVGN